MSEEIFPYDQWVDEALLKVLARALKQLSEQGPVDNHHFFINIQTSCKGVEIPKFLRDQYPDEITIVLQHQYEDLIVSKDGFSVSLSFRGKNVKLKIPFEAVTSFVDPSVNFGLQIGSIAQDTKVLPINSEPNVNNLHFTDWAETEKGIETKPLVKEKPRLYENTVTLEEKSSNTDIPENTNIDHKKQTAEVITLDTFRKK